jgi:8-oxo-dGTP diphosphatase
LRTTGDERSRSPLALPFATLSANETPDQCATHLAKDAASPAVVEQVGTFGATRQSPASGPKVTILYFGLLAARTAFRPNYTWVDVNEASALLVPRQHDHIEAALNALRARVDREPIAFRLLPATFTLSELQRIYELLLGRKLHKASFRRALHAASLVEATDEWRSEGRGRPAQLFRYAPPRRRRARRGVRFDALG